MAEAKPVLRFLINPAHSLYAAITALHPEAILARLQDNAHRRVFYHGTPVGEIQSFSLVEERGAPHICVEMRLDNEESWANWDIAPKLLPLHSRNNGEETLVDIWFNLGITEKAVPLVEA